ncbi:MAG: AAA family ATPase [Serratia sp. (in: enterobacteria)]|uniref:AAA family ATPase n=1 Tax=Serratia sp. (in: enterobacteria) TaxID=616 RepID=UPI003F2AFC4D
MTVLKIKAVKSYSCEDFVEINLIKKTNLFYGQNGSGKSTISGYFYNPDDESYAQCSFSDSDKYRYIVYNSQFVEDSFYNKPEQPGVFTLSQENKGIMDSINTNEENVYKLKEEVASLDIDIESKIKMIKKITDSCQEKIWNKSSKIRERNGGLAGLLTGYLRKASFFQRLNQQEEAKDIAFSDIICDYIKLKDNKNVKYPILIMSDPPLFTKSQLELLSTSLISSGNSYLALLIERLGNTDWVRAGLPYLVDRQCPFCQENTINDEFHNEIKNIFDETYNDTIEKLKGLLSEYNIMVNEFNRLIKSSIASCSYISNAEELLKVLEQANVIFDSNLKSIQGKIEKPSLNIEPVIDNSSLDILISSIKKYNNEISIINSKVEDYDNSMKELENDTWKSLRNTFNYLIEEKNSEVNELNVECEKLIIQKKSIQDKIHEINTQTEYLRKQVSNIDDTINKINSTLNSLGISHFKIKKTPKGNLFQICRSDDSVSNVYKTLSEGEKTLITFLYFLELCDGRLDNEVDSTKEKLIVIDDPISSLSHDYIYEISSLIQYRIINKLKDSKLIILTHNLFFFQELIKLSNIKKEKFYRKYQLYRIVKDRYSNILPIGYDDIKNEYESLWMILKDVKNGRVNSVVLPNVMRKILEYYFSFSCKMEKLSEELDKLASLEKDINYKTFYRYINRGSHFDSVNISNVGQVSVSKYLEMFESIFKKTNDEQHFNKMLGIDKEDATET